MSHHDALHVRQLRRRKEKTGPGQKSGQKTGPDKGSGRRQDQTRSQVVGLFIRVTGRPWRTQPAVASGIDTRACASEPHQVCSACVPFARAYPIALAQPPLYRYSTVARIRTHKPKHTGQPTQPGTHSPAQHTKAQAHTAQPKHTQPSLARSPAQAHPAQPSPRHTHSRWRWAPRGSGGAPGRRGRTCRRCRTA